MVGGVYLRQLSLKMLIRFQTKSADIKRYSLIVF